MVHWTGSLERLAELVGAKANVNAVFGEPIRQGDLTVVPVARVRWGVGGGSGKSDAAPDGPSSASGGGGGAVADPVGYLQIAGAEGDVPAGTRCSTRARRSCLPPR